MDRDVKLGLAVGVFLVGIVGALFLRREPDKKDGTPQLQDVQKLDQMIAEKAHGPYMTGMEEFTEKEAPAPGPKETPKPREKVNAYKVPEFFTTDDGKATHDLLSERPVSTPDPIQSEDADEMIVKPAAPPAHNRDWEVPGKTPGTATPSRIKNQPPERSQDRNDGPVALRKHVIQSGDTLSTLARQYLGSSSRYKEIYEANRQVLRNEDNLPEGTTIVIPSRTADASKSTHAPGPTADQRNQARPSAPSASAAIEGLVEEDAPIAEQPTTRSSPPARSKTATPPTTITDTDEPRQPEAPASSPPPVSRGFVPMRRSPFSAGRVPRTQVVTPQNDEPAPPPRKKATLPEIDVDTASDLQDGDNDVIPARPTSSSKRK